MLPDPTTFKCRPDITSTALQTITDGVDVSAVLMNIDNGNTLRAIPFGAGYRATISVNSQESKENKPIVTDRRAIRVDVRHYDDTLKQELMSSATLVVSIPRGGVFSPGGSEYLTPVRILTALATIGELDSEVVDGYLTYAVSPTLQRMLAGEG
jgi:hypothetical protein